MKQHPLCTDCEQGANVMDLPLPAGLRQEWAAIETRRRFLGRSGKGLGWAALASLMGEALLSCDAHGADIKGQSGVPDREQLKLPHFAPRAKRAIYLFMSGGPPQIDLLDYKPGLAALYDKDIPDSVRGGQQLTGMTAGQARFPIAPSHWEFKRYGKSGTWVSDLLPYTAKMLSDLAIVKVSSLQHHRREPAIMNITDEYGQHECGQARHGRSWHSYGLGSMNDNLPTLTLCCKRR